MSVKRQRARAYGLALEWRAAAWLMLKGYRIVARNFRVQGGEIDLIALSPERWTGQGRLCFVEVRGRKSAQDAQESVDALKQTRIRKAARDFLARNPAYRSWPQRFDVMAAGRIGAMIHNRNAFDL
jgi:putative endonuclease